MHGPGKLKITRRKLPHWQLEGSTYFVTFSLADGVLSKEERELVLQHLKNGDPKFYKLWAVTVMPDHVHILIKPKEGINLSRIMKGIKGVSARMLNQSRGSKGRVWQNESMDRIIRDEDEFNQKLNYMYMNSVNKELVADPGRWDGWFLNLEGSDVD